MLGHDDWSVISVRFRQFGDSDDSAINPVTEPESTLEELLALEEALNTTDLALTLNDSPDPVAAGADLVYSLEVANHGPNPAFSVRIVDTLPAGVTFLSASGASCTDVPQGILTCDLGSFANYQSRQLQITVHVAADLVFQAGGPLSINNTASVSHQAGPDSDTSNNSAATSTQVVAVADLAITSAAQDAPAEVLIGEPTALTVRALINNLGPSAPMDVKLTSTASAAPGTTVTPATLERTEPTLGLNELRPVDQIFTLACQLPGSHTFSFTSQIQPLHAEDTDPNPANNQSQVTVTVDCVIPVAINILPGSLENPIALGSGVIPVAVLTTKAGEYGLPLDFDATQINPPTVRFGPRTLVFANQGGAAPVKNKGHLERSLELDEITKDADTDMILQFPTAQTGLGPQDTEGCVKGRLNGAPGQDFKFFGCDHLLIVPAGAALANPDRGEQAAVPDAADTAVFLPLITR